MKKTLFFALMLATICIMPSCNKELDWFTNKITFGDKKGMVVVEYDSSFLNYSNPFQDSPEPINWIECIAYVDLDDDGHNDIIIDSYGGDYWPLENVTNDSYFSYRKRFTSRIHLESIKLYCDQVYVDDYWHSDTTILHSNDTTIIIIEDYDYYKPISANDTYFRNYQARIVHPCNVGDQLSENYLFDMGPRPLYLFPYDSYGDEYSSNDTIYYHAWYAFDNPENNFPLDEEKYIGLRLKTDDGKVKLGWLKIILVSQPDGTHRMRLLETAIQE